MTTSQFVTVGKTDPLFNQYLLGHKKNGYKLIPVQSLNVGSKEETITFEIKSEKSIEKPNGLVFVTSVIKLKSFILVLFPLFYVITKNSISAKLMDPFSLTFAALALILVYAGLSIRNDISDYYSGFDRVNIPFSEKPLLKGWVTARNLSIISWILIGFSFLFAIPVLILQSEEIKVVVVVIFLLFAGQFFNKNSYKEKRVGELIFLLLMGVGLTSGLQVAAGGGIDLQIICFGIFWGCSTLFLIHINNFSHLITSTPSGIKNTMTQLGFDKAKNFLFIWWSACLFLWFEFHFHYSSLSQTIVQTVLLIMLSLPLFHLLRTIRSPLGSDLVKVRHIAYRTFLTMVTLFFIECIGQLGLFSNWKL